VSKCEHCVEYGISTFRIIGEKAVSDKIKYFIDPLKC